MLFVVVAVVAAIVVVQFSCNLHLFIFAFINKQRERVVVVINIAHTDTRVDRGADSARDSETARRETWENGRRLEEIGQSEGRRREGRLRDRQETCTNIFIFSQFSTLVDKTVNKMQCKA